MEILTEKIVKRRVSFFILYELRLVSGDKSYELFGIFSAFFDFLGAPKHQNIVVNTVELVI